MDPGQFLTRSTIWITIVSYALGVGLFALPERISWRDSATRALWTTAAVALTAHFAFAFEFYHGWSHGAAYRDTARQTAEVVGLEWGGGLFINYALLVAWIADIGWWWRSGVSSYRERSMLLLSSWHAFLILIIFNATVVFEEGFVRWLGLTLSIGLCFAWISIIRQRFTRRRATISESAEV